MLFRRKLRFNSTIEGRSQHKTSVYSHGGDWESWKPRLLAVYEYFGKF